MTENRNFWKTAKPFLTNKNNDRERGVTSQDHQIVKTFNEYLISVPIKNMLKNQEYESFDSSEEDSVSSIIKKYQNHPIIKSIKTKNKSKTFRFRKTNIKKYIEKLDPKNTSQKSEISRNIL